MEFKGIKTLKKKSLYKENLYKQIRDIIKNPVNFNKNSSKRKYLINEKLQSLTILNDFTQIFLDHQLKLPHLEKEYSIFKEILEKSITIKQKRSNSAKIEGRIRQCIGVIIDDLKKRGYIDSFDVEKVIENLNYSRFFHMCISVIFSCVEYTKEEEDIGFKESLDECTVIYVKFLYRLQAAIYLHFTSIILEGYNQMSEALKEVYDEHKIITLNNRIFYEFSNQIGEILTYSLGINEDIKEISVFDSKGRYKSINIVRLPDKIFKEFIPAAHLPQIVEPDTTYEKLSDYLLYQKRVKNGISTIDLSKRTIESLKISQKKKFVINIEAIKLFDLLDSLPYEKIKYIKSSPFVPLAVFEYLEEKIKKLDITVKPEVKEKYIELVGLYNKNKLTSEEKSMALKKNNIYEEDIEKIKELYKLEKEYKQKLNLRYMHNTIIRFAELFQGFPIFFINSLDYRGRMYPWNFMFNRSSGVYKYLLSEFAKEKIDFETLETMKKVFCKSVGINEFALNKEEIILKHKKKFFYYILLGVEIERLIESGTNFSTNFMMEIDQKSSSSVILSIIFGDYNLAKDSNILEKSKLDPPTKLMINSEKYFEGLIEENSLKKLISTRDIHKYLMMCLCYNQTSYGRRKKLSEYIYSFQDCQIIADKYEGFVDTVYTQLTEKIKKFNKIVSFYLDHCKGYQKPIIIDTIDGSRVEWTIFPKKKAKDSNKKKKFRSAITGEYKSYHYEEFETNKMKKSKLILGVMPSFIHSIDASIMRLIITDVYKDCNYIINHLHDSIQYNPKYYKNVINSVAKVYFKAEVHKCLDEKFLANLRNRLLEENREQFDKLVNELKSCDFKVIKIDQDNFQAQYMFPHE